MKEIMNYWHSLKEQEQRLVAVAGVIFIIFILIVGVIRPLNNAVVEAKEEYAKQQELLQFVRQSIVKLKAANASAAPSNTNVSQVVNQTRSRFNITISKMQPSGDGLRVNIDSVEFNQLLGWLDELVHRYHINITNVELSQDQLPGHVRVSRLVLE